MSELKRCGAAVYSDGIGILECDSGHVDPPYDTNSRCWSTQPATPNKTRSIELARDALCAAAVARFNAAEKYKAGVRDDSWTGDDYGATLETQAAFKEAGDAYAKSVAK